MKRLNIILGLISAVLLVGPYAIIYVLDHGNPIMNAWIRSDAEKHLAEMEYQENDYKVHHVIEPKTVINKDYFLTQYMVVFKDEPDVTYYYGKNKKTGKIVQFCEKDKFNDTNDGKTKHSEPHCDFSLKNRD